MDMWHQLYLIDMMDNHTGRSINKIGITSTTIKERFDPSYDPRLGQFDIQRLDRVMIYGDREYVERWEKHLHSKYPKNIWFEIYFDENTGCRDWNNFGGITECVALHHGTEQDVWFGRVKVPSILQVQKNFQIIRDMVEAGEPPPLPLDYVRCTRRNSLTFEQVQACSLQ